MKLVLPRRGLEPRADALADGIDVELWSVAGAGHVPLYEPDAVEQVLDFLLAHQKSP